MVANVAARGGGGGNRQANQGGYHGNRSGGGGSNSKHNYYVSFINDFIKFTWIYLLQYKSEVFQKFHDFQAHVERLFDRKVLAIQTDWGGEYHKLRNFLSASAYPIMSRVHTHISRMVLLNANITTLLRQVYLCLLMPPCR
jgi:hypothetical protein